jgi:hypothetical protein
MVPVLVSVNGMMVVYGTTNKFQDGHHHQQQQQSPPQPSSQSSDTQLQWVDNNFDRWSEIRYTIAASDENLTLGTIDREGTVVVASWSNHYLYVCI